ncbi:unnamed protein product [Peniophora sp. CBMAI 1063]|nr:unnamed protein product [Peniophora sp. CBMAI 1063]
MSESTKSAEQAHVEHLIATKLPTSPIYAFLLTTVQILHASRGQVVARLKLEQHHLNSKNGLHGAVSATIVDWMGGMAIASWDLRTNTGASVDIHCTYQSSAGLGDEVEIEGIADRVGGSMAYTRITIYRVENGVRGRTVVAASHTKFVKA